MSTKMEVRTISSLRADSGSAADFTLRGVACKYNSLSKDLGGFRERVLPGAFANSLASGSDVKALFNHSADKVLGRTQNQTLKLSDTPDNLGFVVQLDKNNSEHRNLYSSVQRGDIDSCSFAFAVDGDDGDAFDTTDDERGQRITRRTIKRANLFDVSVVCSPAYESTSVQARSFADKLFRTTTPKSMQQKFIEEHNGWDPWLDSMRAYRMGLEIRNDNVRFHALSAAKASAEMWADLSAYGTARIRRLFEQRYDGGQAADPTQSFRCAAGSLSSSADEHETAVDEHRTLARRSANRRDAKTADLHFGASEAHALAASKRPSDPDYADACNRAVVACQRAAAWVSEL
jgi:hypothetical protein